MIDAMNATRTSALAMPISSPDNAADPMTPLYARADRWLLAVLVICEVAALALSLYFGRLDLALGIGLPVVGIAAFLVMTQPGRLATRLYMAFAFMAITALQIQLSNGLHEAHFGVFVGLAFLLAYRDWKPILMGAVTIALHHVSFNLFQQWGWGPICFAQSSWALVAMHASYVVVQSALQIFMALELSQDARLGTELARVTESMRGSADRLCLDLSSVRVETPLGRALHESIERIGAVMQEVEASAASVRIASGEIAQGNGDLSERPEQTAANLQ
jgi:methyl-accepting chemotaxis protein